MKFTVLVKTIISFYSPAYVYSNVLFGRLSKVQKRLMTVPQHLKVLKMMGRAWKVLHLHISISMNLACKCWSFLAFFQCFSNCVFFNYWQSIHLITVLITRIMKWINLENIYRLATPPGITENPRNVREFGYWPNKSVCEKSCVFP